MSSVSVSRVVKGALECIHVQHSRGQAVIALQGAQVLSYCPTGARPVIWLSDQASYVAGQPVRGGIPLCWPWFGDLRRNPAEVATQHDLPEPPAHGWARGALWQLDGIVETVEGVTLSLSVPSSVMQQAIAPMPLQLSLEIVVGAALTLRLHNRSRATIPVALTQALHSYFAISDIDNVRVEGLCGVPYIDMLTNWQTAVEQVPVHFTGEVDRIYQGDVASIDLIDAGWERRIRLRSRNSQSLVLWNPHIEKARRLSQFAADAWRRMLCIETANALADSVILQPGAEHCLEVVIETESK